MIKEPTAKWAWTGLDLDTGLFIVSRRNRKAAGALLCPYGTLMENCLSNMTVLPLDGFSLQDWRISLGFSDLGNITRDTFSHGWIVSEQFLQCIRHKHAICQHQACLISPPAFSPSSYIWYLLHGKYFFFFFCLEANSHCRMREQKLFGGTGASWVKLNLLSQENFFLWPWSY